MFSPRTVSDEEVIQYAPLCDRLARIYNGVRGAEYDDLYQEGMVGVLEDLMFLNTPSFDSVKDRVRRWVRFISREGMGGYDDYLETA